MKLSWQWLQEFVDLPGVEATTVGDKLTLHTAELEEIIERKKDFDFVVLGELTAIEPHPDSDTLSVAQFDLGAHGRKQIIFGQVHVVKVGEILPVALAGAALASGIDIGEAKIRGVLSQGMIADNLELGFKQAGLLRFSDPKYIGTPLSEAISALGDTLFDIDNKSLTHRPDLVGHRGFARELAAIFETKLILPEPVIAIPQLNNGLSAKIKAAQCARFCGLKINHVTVGPSDLETQMRLENLGVRAISNLVDITNWIMLEFGQPMHVFDADKVEGDIIVRLAKPGEKLLALDGEEYELTGEDLVIADQVKVLSIAGIMGGLPSSVTADTTNVIFESANFEPVAIRKTSQRLGLRSESSMRFEKSLDPEQCRKALLAAAEKALKACPKAEISSKIVDEYPRPFSPKTIDLSLARIRQLSGIDISLKETIKILQHLGFTVQAQDENLKVQIPSWRHTKDVAIAEDIIEEVVRLYGLDKIPTELPSFPVCPPAPNYLRRLQWSCRAHLAALGYLETYLHSFLGAESFEAVDLDQYTEVANPLSEEYRFLRRDLWRQMVSKLESGLRRHRQVQFFELGKVYHAQESVLPAEIERLLLVRASLDCAENDEFFALKADLQALLHQLGVSHYKLSPLSQKIAHFHPAKTLEIMIDGKSVGYLGVLHPLHLPVKGASLVFAELDLSPVLVSQQQSEKKYERISHFPAVHRDISVILPTQVFAGEVAKTARAAAPLLTRIDLFDEYIDDQKIGKGLKNLAFHLSFQAPDRTLTEAEIELESKSLIKALEVEHQAELRLNFDNA